MGRLGRALAFHAGCDLGKSLEQEKKGFLHMGSELCRLERPSTAIISCAPLTTLGASNGAGRLCILEAEAVVAAVAGVSVGRTQLDNSSSQCLPGHSSEETKALRVRCGGSE